MKLRFIDAENVGLKAIEALPITLNEKVWVVGKSDPIKLLSAQRYYHFISDYSSGPNQADFHLIHHFSRVISQLSRKEKATAMFELMSNDKALIQAFAAICRNAAVHCNIAVAKESQVDFAPKVENNVTPLSNSSEQRILRAISQPVTLDPAFRRQCGIAQGEFTRAVNQLIQSNQIQRCKASKKKWVRCGS